MIHKLYCYENTHPPLGKIFIACGVLMFGMNPFGWRFMGTLFGVFMVPIIYLFAKRFFNKEWISIVYYVVVLLHVLLSAEEFLRHKAAKDIHTAWTLRCCNGA